MKKNLMTEIAKMLGVEITERFIIENADRKETVVLTMDGLHVIRSNDILWPENGKLLSKVLQGLYEVKKLPWEPKKGDKYYYPAPFYNRVQATCWEGKTMDYALKSLGMVYHTKEEAEAHFASDYEKLTNKNWR